MIMMHGENDDNDNDDNYNDNDDNYNDNDACNDNDVCNDNDACNENDACMIMMHVMIMTMIMIMIKEEKEIRKEFRKLDSDASGFITKGKTFLHLKVLLYVSMSNFKIVVYYGTIFFVYKHGIKTIPHFIYIDAFTFR